MTTADYHQRTFTGVSDSEAWIPKDVKAHEIIQGQVDGRYRISLVLFEATDMVKHAKRPPLWVHDYDLGQDAMYSCAMKIVIVLRNGRWHFIEQRTLAQTQGR